MCILNGTRVVGHRCSGVCDWIVWSEHGLQFVRSGMVVGLGEEHKWDAGRSSIAHLADCGIIVKPKGREALIQCTG